MLREILGGDEQAANGLLHDFVRINAPLVQSLESACRSGALQEAERLAHKVLGSARFAGARPLGDALAELERRAREGRREELADLGEQAALAFRQIRDWIATR